MEPGAKKKPFGCPKCGFVQLEPPHLISTYCRACGDYYEVQRPGSAHKASSPLPPLPPLTGKRRDIFCHRCGTTHSVSVHAQSTICPGCNAGIDLVDIEFLTPASLPLDTRGHLHIGPAGSLSNSWMICGSARIEGAISGPLRSEGQVALATRGSLGSEISAPSVLIERHAHTHLTMPVETDELIVKGYLSGSIHCRGLVKVLRGGELDAEVRARAVIVEKGGTLLGDVLVGSSQPGNRERSFKENQIRRAFSPLMTFSPSAAT